MVAQHVIDGLALGSIYAVLALSYALIFGVIRVVNFAQGELVTIGCFGAIGGWYVTAGLPLGARLGVLAAGALLCAAAGGLAMEGLLFRPLLRRSSPALLGLIASLGVSILVQNVLRIGVASEDLLFPPLVPPEPLGLLELQVSKAQLLLMLAMAVLTLATMLLVEHTRFGLTVLAVRDDRELAESNGIGVRAVLRGVFIAASGLAAAGGVMMGLYWGVARYDMGFLPGIKAFTASIMGGIGNVRGAAAAGLLLGVTESLGAAYISSAYKDGFAFLLLVIVLLARPRGLLGRGEAA